MLKVFKKTLKNPRNYLVITTMVILWGAVSWFVSYPGDSNVLAGVSAFFAVVGFGLMFLGEWLQSTNGERR